ncbi:hypothetical protein Herbaro_09270 [Herbaspirillum sp. WKF16]|uniref:hypothetical protein n=1 Tax=Herbaspirillum sp. WKF16 TaxID=3028312 RepID=UPI0023A99DD8|nr:hypothetical protein [Herbaspirillum sp. WKF16]WDZ97950.1 hypothetical protein Herbaro_09270 [Herbaspirillum sp. WKF16]
MNKTQPWPRHTHGRPFSLGQSYTGAEVREFFVGEGRWTEVNATGHAGCAFIVTRMEDDESTPALEERAAYMIQAANVLPELVQALRALLADIDECDVADCLSKQITDAAAAALAAAGAA